MSTTVDLGKVSLSPMDEYTHGNQYEKLDLVTYQRGLFIAKEDNQNILPTVTSTWMKIGDFSEGAVMTDNANGVGHPDGTTITVDANGTFSATCKVVYVTEVPTVSNATRNTLYIQGSSADGFSIYTLIGNTMENVSKMIPKYAGSSSAGGSATSAVKLQNARTIQTNLASTSSASFDGTANVTPGVTGTLPVANGGTGQTTLNAGMNSFINSLDVGTAVPKGEAYFVSQDADGGTLNTYFRRPISKIWDYIKNQIGTKGSATQPIYMNAGVPTACTYTLNKSVPSDAVFTDTTYSNATTSTAGLMSASDKSKLNKLTIASISMENLGLKGTTSSVADFFSALTTKGYSTCGVLYFDYNNAAAGSITGSNITISINGCQCIITNYTGSAWTRKNAIISITGKTYNVWARYEGSTSIADSGIVDISANTWRPVQNNLTSTSTSDCLSAYQGKLLNERVQLLEDADTFKLTNNSYIKIKGNVVTLYSYGGASTTSALNSIKLQSKYRPLYSINIAGYICRVGYTSRYPAYLSIGSDGVMGVYFMQQIGGDAIYHNGTDYWFDGCGTWLNQTS